MPPATRRRTAPTQDPYLEGIDKRSDPSAPERRMHSAAARQRGQANNSVESRRTSTADVKNYDYSEKQDEVLEVVEFAPGQEPAFVRVGAGKTLNLGDFNSLRVDVSVTIPCLPSRVNETYEIASNFVAERLLEEEVKWLGSTNTQRKANRNR